MNIDEVLDQLAERYRGLGYNVIVRPGPDDLPPFARDFKLELMATKKDGSELISAKANPSELEADRNVEHYEEITNRQPGWRFRVLVVGPDRPTLTVPKDATEPSAEEIARTLAEADRLLGAGFKSQAVLAAWAALESAMRRRLRAEGGRAGWGTSPRTMLNELFSTGVL